MAEGGRVWYAGEFQRLARRNLSREGRKVLGTRLSGRYGVSYALVIRARVNSRNGRGVEEDVRVAKLSERRLQRDYIVGSVGVPARWWLTSNCATIDLI